MLSRRTAVIAGLTWTSLALASVPRLRAQAPPAGRHPNPALFDAGDLLWTRSVGEYVPYSGASARTYAADLAEWEHERRTFLADLASGADRFDADDATLARMQSATFDEFRTLYIEGIDPATPAPYSAHRPSPGHVAIIGLHSGQNPYVIEAVKGAARKVQRIAYADWIRGRDEQLVWHGRVRMHMPAERAKIAAEAEALVGAPYSLWTAALDNPKKIYCSKLVWLCVMRALKFPLDGNAQTSPRVWLSPKQLLYSPHISLLHSPADYQGCVFAKC